MSGRAKNEGKQFPPVPESDDEPQVQYQNISLTLLHKLKKADARKMLDWRLGYAERTLTGYRATPQGLEVRAA